jgi:hypothetical protein
VPNTVEVSANREIKSVVSWYMTVLNDPTED